MQYQKIERVRKRLLNYDVSKIVVKICNTEVITKFVNAKNNNKKKQTNQLEGNYGSDQAKSINKKVNC